MKFYLLLDPMRPADFAQFLALGTWTKGSICDGCGEGSEEMVEPLQVEWEEGADHIGSFSWCSYTCIVTDDVRHFFERYHIECKFGRIEFLPPQLSRTRRLRPKFPYQGPNLQWLIATRRILLNESDSSVTLVSACPQCGMKQYKFKRDGLIIDAENINNISMFRIDQFGKSDATFITEKLLIEMKAQRFTNFSYRLAGEIREVNPKELQRSK